MLQLLNERLEHRPLPFGDDPYGAIRKILHFTGKFQARRLTLHEVAEQQHQGLDERRRRERIDLLLRRVACRRPARGFGARVRLRALRRITDCVDVRETRAAEAVATDLADLLGPAFRTRDLISTISEEQR